MTLQEDLSGNMVLFGGSTLFPGLLERSSKKMADLAPSNIKIKVVAPQEQLNSVWIGGSILASLSTCMETMVTKVEFDESGCSIVHRKCLTSGNDQRP